MTKFVAFLIGITLLVAGLWPVYHEVKRAGEVYSWKGMQIRCAQGDQEMCDNLQELSRRP